MALIAAATWALSHPYQGLFHDAGLYTLQALAHLRPDTLSGDVFLKYGSQDRFTVFSPLYAAVARGIGIEPAAALLTLVFQAALLCGAWGLARTVMPPSIAWLGVGVLLAMPGNYGADRIFTCIEPFLTPRMAAEALVLAGLVAALRGFKSLAIALTLAATVLHPIMAAAGIAALYCLYVGFPKPVVAVALAIVGVKALALAAYAMPQGAWGRFDAHWLALVTDRSPYLFVGKWQLDDWGGVVVAAATLLTGIGALPSPRARALATIALITSLGGIALTFIGCDLLHLALLTQLQPWRWQWLGTVTAAILLPQVLRVLWGADAAARTTAVLLLSAWVFGPTVQGLASSGATLLSGGLLRRLKPDESRWVHVGALGLLAIAVTWRLASNLEFTDAHYLDAGLPVWLRRGMSFVRDGVAPALIMAVVWRLAHERRARTGLWIAGVLAAAACAALLPYTWRSWTASGYSSGRIAAFAGLRAQIVPGAEVFWPESPVASWLLLERPSYLSVLQTSGLVFSRPGALELERRARALRGAVAFESFMAWNAAGAALTLSPRQLEDACGTGEFGYLVTAADLGRAPLAVGPAGSGAASKGVRLYRCGAAAHGAGVAESLPP
jgi:hypothetical protein